MRYEAWATCDGQEIEFASAETVVAHRANGLIGGDWKLLHSVDADSWDDAMRRHHQLMEWEPYKPF
jgi:hypothetical protein